MSSLDKIICPNCNNLCDKIDSIIYTCNCHPIFRTEIYTVYPLAVYFVIKIDNELYEVSNHIDQNISFIRKIAIIDSIYNSYQYKSLEIDIPIIFINKELEYIQFYLKKYLSVQILK